MPLINNGSSGTSTTSVGLSTEVKQDSQLIELDRIADNVSPILQNWTTLRTFSNVATDTATLPPASSEFVTLTGSPSTGFNKIIINANLTCKSGAANVLIHLWRRYRSNTSFVRTIVASGQTTNLASGNFQTGDVEIDLLGEPSTDFAIRVEVPSQRYVFSTSADGSNLVSIPNPAFVQSDNLSLSTTTVLPIGLAGFITGWNTTTGVPTIVGLNPAPLNTEKFRLNYQTLATDSIPILGISSRFKKDAVDLTNNTITLDGSTSQSFSVGDTVRLKAGGTCTLPSASGVALNTATTYIISSVTGIAGSQTVTLSSDGTSSLDLSAQGTGNFLYLYPFPFVELVANTDGTFVGATPVLDSTSTVTVSAGTASTVTLASHGFSAGRAFQFSGTTAPGAGSFGTNYYVSATNLTANTFEVKQHPTNSQASVAFSSTGTALEIEGRSCTLTAGTASSFNLANSFFGARQEIVVSGGGASPFSASTVLYVVTPSSVGFTASYLQTGVPIATSSGTVTLTAKVSGNGITALERSEVSVKTVTADGITVSNSAGSTIQITSSNVGQHSLISTNSAKIVSGSVLARPAS